MLSNLIPNIVTEKYLKHESGIILANPIMTKMKYLERGFQLLYFRCPILNSNIKWTLTIPSIIHWRGEEDTHLFILKWLDSLKYGDLTSGFCYNQKLAMKRERKKIFVERQNSQKPLFICTWFLQFSSLRYQFWWTCFSDYIFQTWIL